MRNPFQELKHTEKVPVALEKKVMKSVHLSQLLLNLGELFLGNMGNTLDGLFNIKDRDN